LIPPRSIEDYLTRYLPNNEDYYKKVTHIPSYKHKTEPYQHQKICTYIGLSEDNFLFFADTGAGKTKIVLDILSNREFERALILSPNVSTISTWEDETKKHSNFGYLSLYGSSKERWDALMRIKPEQKLVFLNYAGLVALVSDKEDGKKEVSPYRLSKLSTFFDTVIYDEIHKCANVKSLTFNVCKEISKSCKLRFGLTGTPIDKDPIDFWCEFYLIDLGKTFGKNFYVFREAFFKKAKVPWGFKYRFIKDREKRLYTFLKHKSIRFLKEEMLDLPEKVFSNIKVSLDSEAYFWYERYRDKLLNMTRFDTDAKSSFTKLREICSGFVKEEEDVVDFGTEKIEALLGLIEETPKNDKIIVFLDFVRSGDLVCNALAKNKIKFVRLYGGTKDKVDVKNTFIADKDVKVLVANVRSGGTGLNLQVANYCVFYELPLSYREYLQACDRIHRPGQTKTVFIYHIITKDTIEERVAELLQEGKDVVDALVNGNFFKKDNKREDSMKDFKEYMKDINRIIRNTERRGYGEFNLYKKFI